MNVFVVMRQYGHLACKTIDKIFSNLADAENYKTKKERSVGEDDLTMYFIEKQIVE
jgi:hypothetical protein